ncbi:hypothetical protein [Aquisphaera insulae]|uniref:hypothetical protein n=1 Tax=Aquisphaera insulae TaxID=2712864 RepID=UPI0013ED241A|nr:hypothetical protein [Aquisphaera insulae]
MSGEIGIRIPSEEYRPFCDYLVTQGIRIVETMGPAQVVWLESGDPPQPAGPFTVVFQNIDDKEKAAQLLIDWRAMQKGA